MNGGFIRAFTLKNLPIAAGINADKSSKSEQRKSEFRYLTLVRLIPLGSLMLLAVVFATSQSELKKPFALEVKQLQDPQQVQWPLTLFSLNNYDMDD